MALPTQLPLDRMQTIWKSQIDPVLSNTLVQGSQLKNVTIVSGSNVLNHLLGQVQQGWIITDINSAVTLYRSAPFNDKTLTLTSSGPAVVSLWVY